MDQNRFDVLTRALTAMPSRRHLLRGLASMGFGLGLGVASLSDSAEAKKKRKHKKRKPKATPNQYGCLEISDPCKSAAQCCSGICEGRQGKKRCRAHDTGVCDQEALGYCESASPLQTRCNNQPYCFCTRTTAGSAMCGTVSAPSVCADCTKDADCEALGLPPGSACIPFSAGNCAGNCESGMACMVPCGFVPPEE